jgi:TusE/DsrC/DsvC family sulfur relay protein
MNIHVKGKMIETNEQGFLSNLDDWSEDFASKLADQEGIKLYDDHWELMLYFRGYYEENLVNPTMHQLVLTLGKQSEKHFHDLKAYEKHIYRLFPTDPIHELCKLSGLPMPQPDT